MLSTSFVIMLEEFEGPYGNYILEKGLLHVNYVLKRFLVETTWRCTWSSRWVKALFLEKVLTNADVVQKFSHVGKVWRSTWSQFIEERLSSCEICTKPFSSGHNLKMHITLGKGLTNADIEEIVTKFHQNHSFEDTYYALHKLSHDDGEKPKV